MNINQITVTAGRTFNHTYEGYSNLRPEVTLHATLSDGEDPDAATRALQAKAEKLVEDHKRLLLQEMEAVYQLSQADHELRDLEQNLTRAQSRIEELRKQRDSLAGSSPLLSAGGHQQI